MGTVLCIGDTSAVGAATHTVSADGKQEVNAGAWLPFSILCSVDLGPCDDDRSHFQDGS